MSEQDTAGASTPAQKMQAFESVQKFGRMFPGIVEAFADWAKVGSLEQACTEAQSALDGARASFEAFEAEAAQRRTALDTELSQITARSQEIRGEIEAEAQKIVAAAHAKADDILHGAAQRGDGLLAQGKAALEHHIGLVDQAKAALDNIGNQIVSKTEQLTAITGQIADRTDEHDRLHAAIADVKSRLGL